MTLLTIFSYVNLMFFDGMRKQQTMVVMYKMVHNALCCIIFELMFNYCQYSVPYHIATTVKKYL